MLHLRDSEETEVNAITKHGGENNETQRNSTGCKTNRRRKVGGKSCFTYTRLVWFLKQSTRTQVG